MKLSKIRRLQKQAYKTRHEAALKLEKDKKNHMAPARVAETEESIRQVNQLLKNNFS